MTRANAVVTVLCSGMAPAAPAGGAVRRDVVGRDTAIPARAGAVIVDYGSSDPRPSATEDNSRDENDTNPGPQPTRWGPSSVECGRVTRRIVRGDLAR